MTKPVLLTLMGPTASGKTDLAMALSKSVGAEIVSVDSALIYKGMDIGTAKPSKQELVEAPHRLIDIRDPSEAYSVAEFVNDAHGEISEISRLGKIPLLVGGTMMYFKSLVDGLSPMPPANPKLRAEIESRALQSGWHSIHAELVKVDPELAQEIHPNHSQRLGRAYEVFLSTGVPMSQWQKRRGARLEDRYNVIQMCLHVSDRSVLHQRIEQRFERMLETGFIDEVKALHSRGDLNPDMPSIRAVGYRQVWEFLEGTLDYDTMKGKGIAATRQLAKRQLTWLRGWQDLNNLEALDVDGSILKIDEILASALNVIKKRTI